MDDFNGAYSRHYRRGYSLWLRAYTTKTMDTKSLVYTSNYSSFIYIYPW